MTPIIKHLPAALIVVSTIAAQTTSSTPISISSRYNYITIDHPGAVQTYPLGINSKRQIAGYYVDAQGVPHGFVYDSGTFTPVVYPGALATAAGGINDRGDVSGVYIGADGYQHGYIWSRPTRCDEDNDTNCKPSFQSLDVPGAAQTMGIPFEFGPGLGTGASGINNGGQVVGLYATTGLYSDGFIYTRGHYLSVDDPSAAHLPGLGSKLFSINNAGTVAGDYITQANSAAPPITHGFLYANGKFTPVYVPGSEAGGFGTQVNGVNDFNIAVGLFSDPVGLAHAMMFVAGQFFTLDYPGQPFNEAHAINNRGDITGAYINDPVTRIAHGFLATLKGF